LLRRTQSWSGPAPPAGPVLPLPLPLCDTACTAKAAPSPPPQDSARLAPAQLRRPAVPHTHNAVGTLPHHRHGQAPFPRHAMGALHSCVNLVRVCRCLAVAPATEQAYGRWRDRGWVDVWDASLRRPQLLQPPAALRTPPGSRTGHQQIAHRPMALGRVGRTRLGSGAHAWGALGGVPPLGASALFAVTPPPCSHCRAFHERCRWASARHLLRCKAQRVAHGSVFPLQPSARWLLGWGRCFVLFQRVCQRGPTASADAAVV
jgi:hypothetical protein